MYFRITEHTLRRLADDVKKSRRLYKELSFDETLELVSYVIVTTRDAERSWNYSSLVRFVASTINKSKSFRETFADVANHHNYKASTSLRACDKKACRFVPSIVSYDELTDQSYRDNRRFWSEPASCGKVEYQVAQRIAERNCFSIDRVYSIFTTLHAQDVQIVNEYLFNGLRAAERPYNVQHEWTRCEWVKDKPFSIDYSKPIPLEIVVRPARGKIDYKRAIGAAFSETLEQSYRAGRYRGYYPDARYVLKFEGGYNDCRS